MANNNSTNVNRLVSKFLRVFMMVFAILVILIGIFTGGYMLLNNGPEPENNPDRQTSDETSDDPSEVGVDNGTEPEEQITTFAVFGVDKDGFRTDVTMLVFLNRETLDIDIISIPRDTWIRLPEDVYATLLDRRSDTPEFMKINGVPAYAEPNLRNETSVDVLEQTFGIDIDYYISLDLEGFIAIVDLVGPVIMDIPEDMVYNDPIQDLYIDISAGENQEINGALAEGIIRYRSGYTNGDLGRIDMQHEFMVAFMEQLLNLDNRLNIVNIATAAALYVKTDFYDAIDYVNYIDDIDMQKIEFYRLPGTVSDADTSHYIYDYDATKLLLNQIINYEEDIEAVEDTTEIDQEEVIEPEVVIDVKSLTIVVLNGTYEQGLAGRTSTALAEAGYTMGEADNYSDKPVERTIIQVPDAVVGEELKVYFNNPEIQVNAELMNADVQVTIILGETDAETY